MSAKVEYLTADDYSCLCVKGDFTKDEIIKMAVKQHIIGDGDFVDSEYHQSFYKAVPLNDDSGYKTWHHPLKQKCRGAYFASVLYQY